MKLLTLFAVLAFGMNTLAGGGSQAPDIRISSGAFLGTYGIHLFFNEEEFVDTVEIQRSHTNPNALTGMMHVPNDFNAPIENIQTSTEGIEFEVLVPKNTSRPKDLLFHYKASCFDTSCNQLIGFVTIKGENEFVASFTAFKR